MQTVDPVGYPALCDTIRSDWPATFIHTRSCLRIQLTFKRMEPRSQLPGCSARNSHTVLKHRMFETPEAAR